MYFGHALGTRPKVLWVRGDMDPPDDADGNGSKRKDDRIQPPLIGVPFSPSATLLEASLGSA